MTWWLLHQLQRHNLQYITQVQAETRHHNLPLWKTSYATFLNKQCCQKSLTQGLKLLLETHSAALPLITDMDSIVIEPCPTTLRFKKLLYFLPRKFVHCVNNNMAPSANKVCQS